MSGVALAARLVGLVTLTAIVGGCAVLGASRGTTRPPLTVPEAPPRVVAEFPADVPLPEAPPVEEATLDEVPVVEEAAEPPARPSPSVPRTPEPVAEQAPEVAPEPPQLKPAPGFDLDAETVRRGLNSTRRVLDSINRTTLDAAGRAQHDTARQFHNQATLALEAGNVVFAHYLNEKAETLAIDLASR